MRAASRPQLCELTIQAYERNSFRCIERGQVFLIHCTLDQMQSRYLEFHSIPRILHHGEQKVSTIHLASRSLLCDPSSRVTAKIVSVLYLSRQLIDSIRKLYSKEHNFKEHRAESNKNTPLRAASSLASSSLRRNREGVFHVISKLHAILITEIGVLHHTDITGVENKKNLGAITGVY